MTSIQSDRPHQLPSQQSQQSPAHCPPKKASPSLPAYKQLSRLFKNYTSVPKAQLQEKVDQQRKLIPYIDQQVYKCVEAVLELTVDSRCAEQPATPQISQEESAVAAYWARCMNSQPENRWSYSQCMIAGHQIMARKIVAQSQSVLALNKCKPFIVYNNMVCLYQLGMLQEALKISENIIQQSSQPFSAYASELRMCIMLKMGVKITKEQKQTESRSQRMKYLLTLQKISNMNKETLRIWILNFRKEGSKLHVSNWYNLAVICKIKNLFEQGISILQFLVQLSPTLDKSLISKCYIQLAELYEIQTCYQQAIQALRMVDTFPCSQLQMKIWCLKKKIKIQMVDKAKIEKALLIDPRFAKLNNLENELRKITKKNQYVQIEKAGDKKKTKRMHIVFKAGKKVKQGFGQQSLIQIKQKVALKEADNSKRSTQRFSHNILLNKKQSIPLQTSKNSSNFNLPSNRTNLKVQTPRAGLNSVKTSLKFIQSNLNSPANSRRQVLAIPSQKEKKEEKQIKVRFNLSESSSSEGAYSIYSLIEAYEQRIAEHLFQEDFETAIDEIKDAEQHLQQLQQACRERAVAFTVKLSKWCRQAGKERYATLLLKRVLLRHQDGEHRVQLLQELGRHYEELKEYKSAIEVNLELVRLGKSECLDKLGEMHMLRQNYSEALKYYERYHEVRNDTYSLVKLAHAYSKIPSFSKRALDLLNDLLFVNKTSCIFRHHLANETDDFQSALLLLATIYMNLNGHKKAADICEKYLKEDFGAYPIFYILGVLRLREERREEAFSCFLNAVRLKPNHLPSLLELLRFLTSRTSEVLAVLRKAFQAHHRDWDLLQMLVEAATKSPSRHSKISIPALIDCAKALEGAGLEGLQLEVETVWLWAAELIDDRQRRMSVVDQEFVENVYVRLGEIALKKGNYPLSERYFSKVLQKLQLERGRLKTKPRIHYSRLEIEILRRMAYIKSERRETEVALGYLQQSKKVAIENDLPLEAFCDSEKIAQLYFVMQDYQQAAQEFTSCCRQLEQQPEGREGNWEKWKDLQLEIGNCYQNLHQWRQARRVYQCILSYRLCEEAIRNLANLYAWQGNPELAKELLQGLRVLRPTPALV